MLHTARREQESWRCCEWAVAIRSLIWLQTWVDGVKGVPLYIDTCLQYMSLFCYNSHLRWHLAWVTGVFSHHGKVNYVHQIKWGAHSYTTLSTLDYFFYPLFHVPTHPHHHHFTYSATTWPPPHHHTLPWLLLENSKFQVLYGCCSRI